MRKLDLPAVVRACLVFVSPALWAGPPAAPAAHARSIARQIDDTDRVIIPRSVHPLARQEFDLGPADADMPMDRMVLVLRRRSGADAELDRLIEAQQDPGSPNFHRWLTPAEFGKRFGISDDDLGVVLDWLQGHGFTIDEIPKGRGWVNFSGTVREVEGALRTRIHLFFVDGQIHTGNMTEFSVPPTIGRLTPGPLSLNNFFPEPHHPVARPAHRREPLNTTTGGDHFLAPGDFWTIYDSLPLISAGTTGQGVAIAIPGKSDISLSDIQAFRSNFGLPSNDPTLDYCCGPDPGLAADQDEATLDVTWAGAAAPDASIILVAAKDTSTTGGVVLAAQSIVNNNLAPIVSLSYADCEQNEGASGSVFWAMLWQQAASQGISVVVSSGDSGAAMCDSSSATSASGGLGVNVECANPYSTCVGGTEFDDRSNPGLYWSTTNGANGGSALGYIPEVAWNESGTNPRDPGWPTGLWSSGGGASLFTSKPGWQSAPGVPNDGARDVPDVALAAAGHDGYWIYLKSQWETYRGTSLATPSLAGIVALLVQSTGQRQGLLNPRLYQLASGQYSGTGPAVFHDIISGNNSVPGQQGYSCGPDYDLVTGLGSVDATALVNNWTASGPSPDFSLSLQPTSLTITAGAAASVAVSSSISGGFNSPVSLSVSGLPIGVTATFDPTTIAAPGSGSSTLTLAVSFSVPSGSYSFTVTGSGGMKSHSVTGTLTVTFPTNQLPDLIPYQPQGWSAPIVVSKVTGTNTDDSPLLPTDSLYLDWAVVNVGNAAAAAGFNIALFLDGVQTAVWHTTAALEPNFYTSIRDFPLGMLTAGTHTLKIVADSTNLIAESDETNNEYTKMITIGSASSPNLTPYQPQGWSAPIVVSTALNATTDSSPIHPTDQLYVDFAVTNDGVASVTTRFYVALFVDGQHVSDGYYDPPLPPNHYVYWQNFQIDSLSAGTHTIEIVADSTNVIQESDETNNSYSKTIVVTGAIPSGPVVPISPPPPAPVDARGR